MKTSWIVGGVLALLVGLGFIFPAFSELRQTGALPALGVVLLFWGVILTLVGGKLTLSGIRSPKL